MTMTMSQAYKVVAILYTHGTTVGWLKRKRRSPLFVVGYTSIDMQGAQARVTGSSNVDWESAFENAAASDGESERERIYSAIREARKTGGK